jgi:hypothetical protein
VPRTAPIRGRYVKRARAATVDQRRRHRIARGVARNVPRLLGTFLGAMAGWLLLALFVLPHFFGASALVVLPVGAVALATTLLVFVNLPGWIDVGSDGLNIDWRSEKRFVSFVDLEDAKTYAENSSGKQFVGAELILQSGEVIRVPIGENHFGAAGKARELVRHIVEELSAFRVRDEGADTTALERRGRTTSEWIERLKGIAAGANAGHREAEIPEERLWRIVEDPGAKPGARAGAATALRSRIDERGRKRLRIAASEIASPKLRVAVQSAATGDDAELAAALDEVESAAEEEQA